MLTGAIKMSTFNQTPNILKRSLPSMLQVQRTVQVNSAWPSFVEPVLRVQRTALGRTPKHQWRHQDRWHVMKRRRRPTCVISCAPCSRWPTTDWRWNYSAAATRCLRKNSDRTPSATSSFIPAATSGNNNSIIKTGVAYNLVDGEQRNDDEIK